MIITNIGPYEIGQKISRLRGVEEYSEEEYENFAAGGSPRTSPGEKFYRGERVYFAGTDNWEITIGVIDEIIYKFGLVKMGVWKSMTNETYSVTKNYLMNIYQKPAKSSVFSKELIWVQQDGNITLNIRSAKLPGASKKISGVIVDITSGETLRQLGIS